MAEPKVVHCKRQTFDVYVGRPSKWGNPFVVGVDGNREQVIERYRGWLFQPAQHELLAAVVPELRGKTLGCWCAPKACHADVLLEVAMSNDSLRKLAEQARKWREQSGAVGWTDLRVAEFASHLQPQAPEIDPACGKCEGSCGKGCGCICHWRDALPRVNGQSEPQAESSHT